MAVRGEKGMKDKEIVFDTVQLVNNLGMWRVCDICKKSMHNGDMFSRLYYKGKRVGAMFTTVDICSDCLEIE